MQVKKVQEAVQKKEVNRGRGAHRGRGVEECTHRGATEVVRWVNAMLDGMHVQVSSGCTAFRSVILQGHGKGENKQTLWMLHGGPGTGKSHVIRLLKEELFEKECGWISALDFQLGALQAVSADNLDGHTLHHALGLQPFESTTTTWDEG